MVRTFRSLCPQLLILNSTLIILLASCSVQKQITRTARKTVLADSILQTAHIGISVYEPAAGRYWYNYQGDKYFVPASNTKIPTCYAAMKYLGDSLAGLEYVIKDSSLYIKGTGDPTFLHRDFPSQPVLNFLQLFESIEMMTSSFADTRLGNGWSWNDYQESYMPQRNDFPIYGNIVRFEWKGVDNIHAIPSYFQSSTKNSIETLGHGFRVFKRWEENSFTFWSGNEKARDIPFNPDISVIRQLLTDTLKVDISLALRTTLPVSLKIHSRPTDSLLKPMMHRSDNFFAEQSLLMVSNELLGYMNDAHIIDSLLKTDFKDLPQKPRWVDGSGLSRYNLFTPQDFVAILNKMQKEFGMERIKVIFPTGGKGTISNYYKTESGFIFAKTGTLSGVVAFSGFLYTRKGKLLIFSTLVNNHHTSATDIRKSIERFLRDLRNKY